MGKTMDILQKIKQLVNEVLKSRFFWLSILGLILLSWLAEWKPSRIVKSSKLLAEGILKVVALFLALFGIQLDKIIKEAGVND